MLQQDFISFLKDEHHYPDYALELTHYDWGIRYPRVNVRSDGYITQSFVVMTKEQFARNRKFPYYRSEKQTNPYGVPVRPVCSIAVKDGGIWKIYDPHDMSEREDVDGFLNYQAAGRRMNRRIGDDLMKSIKRRSCLISIFVVCYLFLYVLSINNVLCVSLPMDASIVSLVIVLSVLILFPIVMPYLSGFSLFGFNFDKRPSSNRTAPK